MTTHRRKTQFGKKHTGLKADDEDFLETNRMMTTQIFKGKTELTFDEYIELRNSVQEILWHYEYFQLETDSND